MINDLGPHARADRLHRADRSGSGLVQRSVLGVVLPAAGFQGGAADHGLHRGSRAAHRNAELDPVWLAVRHHRPQAGDLGRHVARVSLTTRCLHGLVRSPSRAISTIPSRSSSSSSSCATWGWSMDRSGRFWQNSSPAGFAARRCRCRTISATAGAAAWCPAAFQSTGSLGYALIYPIAVPAVCFVLGLFLMPETRHISIWKPVEAKSA